MAWKVFLFALAVAVSSARSEKHSVQLTPGGSEVPIQNPGGREDCPSNLITQWDITTEPGNTIVLDCPSVVLYRLGDDCPEYSLTVKKDSGTKTYCGSLHRFVEKSVGSMELTLTIGKWNMCEVDCKVKALIGDGIPSEEVHLKIGDDAYLVRNPGYPSSPPRDVAQKWVLTVDEGFKIGFVCDDSSFSGGDHCDKYDYGLLFDDGVNKFKTCERVSKVFHEKKLTVVFDTSTGEASVFSCRAMAVRSGLVADYFKEVESEEVDSTEHGIIPGRKGTTCPCGWSNSEDGQRIINGTETRPNEYSFMVGLGGEEFSFCGASILTKDYLLTAAHCTANSDASELTVHVGAHDFNEGKQSKWTQKIKVAEIIDHDYIPNQLHKNDISILRLERSIQFNEKIGPVCLPRNLPNLNHERVRVIGWGATEIGYPRILRKGDMRLVDTATCKALMDESIDLENPLKVCYFSRTKQACYGDSGGPVVWLDPETNMYTQVTLNSYGRGCQTADFVVGPNLSQYMDWIVKTIGGPGCTKAD